VQPSLLWKGIQMDRRRYCLLVTLRFMKHTRFIMAAVHTVVVVVVVAGTR
jgi:hypothetical protein